VSSSADTMADLQCDARTRDSGRERERESVE
jgi:hypothetical protein